MALSVCQWLLFIVDCLSLLYVVYLLFVVVGCWCLLLVGCSLVVHCLVVYCSFVGLSFSHSLVIQSFIGCLLVYRFTSG